MYHGASIAHERPMTSSATYAKNFTIQSYFCKSAPPPPSRLCAKRLLLTVESTDGYTLGRREECMGDLSIWANQPSCYRARSIC